MEQKEKSTTSFMRALHRDIGFFVVGLTIVYSLSGIVLVYRDTDFLKSEVRIERTLPANTAPDELGKMLRLKGFKVLKTEGDVLHFQEGTYNKATGLAVYQTKKLPSLLEKFVDLHKTMSGKITHWFAVVFGALLCFLAVSSFWMCKKGTNTFRRGIYVASAGVVVTVVVLLL
jgi:hypothetical protein